MPSPLQLYEDELERRSFTADPAQRAAALQLDQLYQVLVARESGRNQQGLLSKLLAKLWPRKDEGPVRGLYFWGGVGRGKTWLIDLFFDALPFDRKMRTHFHRFMQHVHAELLELAGSRNPLDEVAERLAQRATIICFDEFFVSDITDAMILAGLLQGLFERGVSLVATSNIVPDQLYKDGLQRQRFLPAIALLNEHTEVVNLDGGTDYRLRALERAELYHWPLDEGADSSLLESFESLAPEAGHANAPVEINGRVLHSRLCADDVIWFSFAELCDGPRSQNDYIELARIYHAVLLSDVPLLGVAQEDQARRFINLVDEFYDRNVKLVISAAAPPAELYTGNRVAFEFARTISRLQEMQSHDYLAREHRP